jgi:hypothetical protein
MGVVGSNLRCGTRPTTAGLVLGLLPLLLAGAAEAQEMPRGAVLRTTVSVEELRGVGEAVDRLLRTRLDALEVVDVSGTPLLDLPDLQLAVGCIGETAECLAAVAGQLEVQLLITPALLRAGDELVLTVSVFDARDGSIENVARRASGDDAGTELLDQLDTMLRDLFGLPPAPVVAPIGPVGGDDDDGPGLSPVPFVVMGAGAAMLVSAAVIGSRSANNEDDYRDTVAMTEAEVDALIDLRDKAERQARAANALFAIGGAAAATGLVLLLVMRGGDDDEEPSIAVAPAAGPGGGGLVLSGRLGRR